jgi:hypothetical protein
MAHPWHHALSSAAKYGGNPEDYLPIHSWFDGSKSQMANFRHRALRHHAFGIFEMEALFGPTLRNSAGKVVPTRFIGEQHVREDCGGIVPSAQDWLHAIPAKPWMNVGRIAGDAPPLAVDGSPDFSLEAWRAAVAAGETILGHRDWADRMGNLLETSRA